MALCFLLFAGGLESARAVEDPWNAGERLRYEIHWGTFVAAEVEFRALRLAPDGWQFEMDLDSRGMVDVFYPIRSRFQSVMDTERWRSLRFEAERKEGGREKHYDVSIAYREGEGIFRNRTDGTDAIFEIPEADLHDLLSMLYAMRRHPWETNPVQHFQVYEDRSIKTGTLRKVREVKMKDRSGRSHTCWLLEGQQIVEDENKKPLKARIWLTQDDQRLPIRAECEVKFGTFRMTWVDR